MTLHELSSPGLKPLAPKPKNPELRGLGLTLKFCRPTTTTHFITFKHESYKKFPCSQCEHIATRMDKLLKHEKSIHKGVQFPCFQCDYKASHLLTHTKSIHYGEGYSLMSESE